MTRTPARDAAIPYDLAGMTMEDGQLGRPFDAPGWMVPSSVAADSGGELLTFNWKDGGHIRQPKSGMLERFIRLVDSRTVDPFVRYARSWGPLGLCSAHDLPYQHHPLPRVARLVGAGGPQAAEYRVEPGLFVMCEPAVDWDRSDSGASRNSEPISAWRGYAHQAQAIVQLAAALHTDSGVGASEWWEALGHPNPSDVGQGRRRLAGLVGRWLHDADIAPQLNWPAHSGPMVTLGAMSLFGALAVQLLTAVARSGWALCSSCGAAYSPIRAPRIGQRNYCPKPTCGTKARHRFAQQQKRRRARA